MIALKVSYRVSKPNCHNLTPCRSNKDFYSSKTITTSCFQIHEIFVTPHILQTIPISVKGSTFCKDLFFHIKQRQSRSVRKTPLYCVKQLKVMFYPSFCLTFTLFQYIYSQHESRGTIYFVSMKKKLRLFDTLTVPEAVFLSKKVNEF